MSNQKTNFLFRVANDEHLKENLLSIIFAKNPNVDISKRELFFDNVKRFYNDYKIEDRIFHLELIDDNEVSEISKWENKDFRISKITINNLRAFPKSEIPFGINFNEDNDISSYIIIGSNGVGKSSLFNALEYSYTKRIGEAELRTNNELEDEDSYFKSYLQHYNNPFNECQFNIFTKEGEDFSLDKENIPLSVRKLLNPNNHFISEFDITTNCKLNFESSNIDSFNHLIAKNVGLSEFIELDKNLFQFIKYNRLTESNNVKKAKNNLDDSNKKIKSYSDQLVNKNKLLNKSKEDLSEELRISSLKSLSLVNELKTKDYSINYQYEDLRKNIIRFNEQNQSMKKLSSKIGNISEINFLETGLRLLQQSKDCPFCKNSKLSKTEIEKSTESIINEYQSYKKISSELEYTSVNILESINLITNIFYKLRHQVELEIKQTSENFISKEYEDVILNIRNTLINITSSDLIIDLEKNKEKIENSNTKTVEFIQFLFEKGENYIYEQLPYFIKTLNILNDRRKTSVQYFEEKVNSNRNITDRILQESVLQNEIKELEIQINNLNNGLQNFTNEYEIALKEYSFYVNVKKEATELYRIVHKEINNELTEIFEPLKEIILAVLNDYLSESRSNEVELILENEPDEFDIETGEILSNKIVAYIKERKENIRIPVNKYLNTFHYKLFCTMVAISIAIASRKKTKINLPLILDDIFYSSDFENRATIEKFIKKLFSLFKQYTPNMPLQLIMFTHDNMIFDSAIHAVNNSEEHKINFAKLFHPKDATITNDYKNIISKIPSQLPFKILSKVYA